MNIPVWLLRLLPMWDYICPKCRKEVEKTSNKCPYCGEQYGNPVRVPPRLLKDPKALEDYVHKHVFPRVSKAQRDYLAQYFTELFSDGFEAGNFDLWTSVFGSPTVVGSPVYQGSHAAQFYVASNWGSAYLRKSSGITSNPWNVRFYLRITNLPPSGQYFRFARSLDTNWAELFTGLIVNVSGTLKLRLTRSRPSSNTTDYSFAFQADTWYCIEYGFYAHASAGYYKVWLDGSEVITDSGLNTSGNSAGILDLALSGGNSFSPLTIHADCVVVADTYIGPETTEQTYTKTWTTDTLFKKLGITKTLNVDTAFQKQNIPKTFGLDSTFQKSFTIQKQLDALFKKLDKLETFGINSGFLKRNISKSFTVDTCFSALITQTISRQIDALFKKLDATKTFGLDAQFGAAEAETYARTFGLDIIFAYKVRLPELWLDENGKLVLNISKPYTWVGT